MSLLFSRQCEYALQAVLYLARKPAGTVTSIKEIAEKLEIPFHFLAKILQDLTHKGLLLSTKGRSGGFALAVPVDNVTLFQIIDAVDGSSIRNTCVLGFGECSEKNPCSLHDEWVKLREGLFDVLDQKNITRLAKDMKKPVYQTVDV